MVIFGTRGITYSKGNGDFHCPECASKGAYRHRRVRNFFTLYFIPLIPLNLHGEYIECQQCRGTYKMEILDYDPEAGAERVQAEFHHAVKLVMVEMMLADGDVDAEEVKTIQEIYGRLTGGEMSDSDVRSEIDQAQRGDHDMNAALQQCSATLNDSGKEMIVKAAFMVAAADGEFQDEEKELLATVGRSLNMTNAHVNGVITTMVD